MHDIRNGPAQKNIALHVGGANVDFFTRKIHGKHVSVIAVDLQFDTRPALSVAVTHDQPVRNQIVGNLRDSGVGQHKRPRDVRIRHALFSQKFNNFFFVFSS